MKPQHSTSPQWLTPETALFLRHALPNGVTILALCFGLTALVFANDLNITAAIACVLIAAILDACDGRVARATGCASKFGAELDSLADFLNFGVALVAVGSALFVRYSMSRYMRYWLLRLVYEQRLQTDRTVEVLERIESNLRDQPGPR